MASDYEKNRAFGKPENIEKRLAMWATQLSMDKSYPWVGLGLIDDLECACRMLGGEPNKQYPDMRKPALKPEPEVVYDL
jgi:hypothetical protein